MDSNKYFEDEVINRIAFGQSGTQIHKQKTENRKQKQKINGIERNIHGRQQARWSSWVVVDE